MNEKLCVFCKHFGWSDDYGYYGDYEGGPFCQQRHYQVTRIMDEDDLRSLILKAETCADYERPA